MIEKVHTSLSMYNKNIMITYIYYDVELEKKTMKTFSIVEFLFFIETKKKLLRHYNILMIQLLSCIYKK